MIYFIQAGKNGPIKIGKSENPKERLSQLQTANYQKLILLWILPENDAWTEDSVHEMF